MSPGAEASADVWRPLDCHAHTTRSDGALEPRDMIARVRARGVRPTISDHLTNDVAGAPSSVDGVRAYLDEIEPLDALAGGEFCWQDALWRELPDDLWRRLDIRLGSLHAVFLSDGTMQRAFTRTLVAGVTPAVYMNALVDNAERLAVEMPVDILAHPTLVALPYRDLPAEELWTESHEERFVEALASGGICFEISNRYRAHERLVRRAVARGVRLSLGSDGHTDDQVGDVAWPRAFAHLCGVHDGELYDPELHGSRSAAMRGA